MSDWGDGYVTDIEYTFGYHPELNPLRMNMPLLGAGHSLPKIETACELAFGQGLSMSIHSAASEVAWYGTDFNPSHAAFAQDLAASRTNQKIYSESFAEFCSRSDLPDFDFIAVHGIWTWVSDENRAVMLDFVRRKLKAGGVLFVSYNAMPGWANMAPVRELMRVHSEVMSPPGIGALAKMDAALEFSEKLFALNPRYAAASPGIVDRLRSLKTQHKNYVAAEYLGRSWRPMSFEEIAAEMSSAKLSFACSSNYVEQFRDLTYSPDQLAFLDSIPDPTLRELVGDFLKCEQFRRDYWVKGLGRITPAAKLEQFRKLRFQLVTNRKGAPMKLRGRQSEWAFSPPQFEPILDLMADHKARTPPEISEALGPSFSDSRTVFHRLLALCASGALALAQDEEIIGRVKASTDGLNRRILEMSRSREDIRYLASPVTGGGHSLDRMDQLLLLARLEGRTGPKEQAGFVWEILRSANTRLVKDGIPVASDSENLAILEGMANNFAARKWPGLQHLQIV